jgi:hypothetical protein
LNDLSPFDPNLYATDAQFSDQPFSLINQQAVPVSLFDLNQPQYPNSTLMPHYIQIFIQHFGAKCPFITYYDTLERFNNGILPPMLCNSIAALAVRCVWKFVARLTVSYLESRFSDLPALVTQGLENIAIIYKEASKVSSSGSCRDPALISWTPR